MKIAITSTGTSFDDMVESDFRRCDYFLIIDMDNMELEALPNPSKSTIEGAAIQTAQLLARKNVSVLLTGRVGPDTFQTFNDSRIYVMSGLNGQVRQAVTKYISWGQDHATANKKSPHSRITNSNHLF